MYDENDRLLSNRNPNNNRGIRRSFSTQRHVTKAPNRETLWDLEIEKEKAESLNENGDNFDYKSRDRRADGNLESSSSFAINQNLISSISSTGVLVKPLNQTDSVLDFIFVLNVRESETFPPLYLAEDVNCVEEKMKNYQGEYNIFEKYSFCVSKRYVKFRVKFSVKLVNFV